MTPSGRPINERTNLRVALAALAGGIVGGLGVLLRLLSDDPPSVPATVLLGAGAVLAIAGGVLLLRERRQRLHPGAPDRGTDRGAREGS